MTALLINKRGGISIIGVLFLGLLMVLVLSYFGISIRAIIESPAGQDNFHYLGEIGSGVWDHFLKPFYDYIAANLLPSLTKLEHSFPTNFNLNEIHAPSVKF